MKAMHLEISIIILNSSLNRHIFGHKKFGKNDQYETEGLEAILKYQH